MDYRQAVLVCVTIHFSSNISGNYRPLRSGWNWVLGTLFWQTNFDIFFFFFFQKYTIPNFF